MSDRWRKADGFQTASGVLAITTGPFLLACHQPAGWTFLIMASGVALLGTQYVLMHDITFEAVDTKSFLQVAVAIASAVVAVVYLTRAANDLPSLFPGHDGDSEQFRILPGVVMLTIGAVLFIRAVLEAKPTRATD